ncbi:MAG: NAD(P)/FAD-dependent oxidoreductase [Chloroflexota bacterium]|nr:MAG: NAD(P)/FAD-dependent oxidoreductase [Chloroflexota bacterium]
MMEREIVVVGAGPSGSATAISLARQGHDVLLLDRKGFPRDKTCGDGIPAGAIEVLYSLGMEEKIREADFYPVDRILLSSPREYVLEADLKPGVTGASSYVVPRTKFDALIQEHAVECGAEFRQAQVQEPIVEDGRVVGVRAKMNGSVEEVRSKVVIGADGVTSALARALRPDKHEDGHRAIALRSYTEDLEVRPHQVEFYLYKGILPGYAWIFPISENQTNLGLGMRLDKYRDVDKSLEDMVEVFLEMPVIKQRLRRGGELKDVAVWQLNFGSRPMQRAYDGAILVGDAAGLINPLTGGGIHNGLQSALLAGEIVHDALKKDDLSLNTLQRYDTQLEEKMRGNMRKSYWIQKTLIQMPLWVDLLIRFGGANSEVAKIFIDKL